MPGAFQEMLGIPNDNSILLGDTGCNLTDTGILLNVCLAYVILHLKACTGYLQKIIKNVKKKYSELLYYPRSFLNPFIPWNVHQNQLKSVKLHKIRLPLSLKTRSSDAKRCKGCFCRIWIEHIEKFVRLFTSFSRRLKGFLCLLENYNKSYKIRLIFKLLTYCKGWNFVEKLWASFAP